MAPLNGLNFRGEIGRNRRSTDTACPVAVSTLDHRPGEPDVALGDLERDVALQGETLEHLVGTKTDDRIVRPRHAHVGDERRATRQNPLIGRRHVGVGAEHRAHPTIEIVAQGLLLARRLGVEVDQDHPDVVDDELRQQTVRHLER